MVQSVFIDNKLFKIANNIKMLVLDVKIVQLVINHNLLVKHHIVI